MSYIARALGIHGDLWEDDGRIHLLAKYEEPYTTFTNDLEQAMVFDSAIAALEFTRQVYTADPVREDGKPNRPLTGFLWEFSPLANYSSVRA